ncbi:sensor histidine kinase [Streptomonospora wellingtoniae]|uniref:histidine kinase n=1 Tax=Streptomonospora wellingtoniae TaxID=3075544 RepID=A0ABU2KPT2_9ACTN|nr:histidine kinase [Streptomonospora sp. DSM 45055]MDT0301284.1 histidine kinase [Streptomonospora sp. DSM 45055]
MRLLPREGGGRKRARNTGSRPARGPGTDPAEPGIGAIATDAAVACGYAIVFVSPGQIGGDQRGWLLALVVSAVALPLAFRRLRPVPVFLVVLAANAAALAAGAVRDPMLAAAFALYPVALQAPPAPRDRTRWSVLAWAALVLAAVAAGGANLSALPTVAVSAVALGGSWVLGRAVAERREQAARAVRESVLRAVAEERLHLARELHDVVSGTLNAVLVQASVGNHVARHQPGRAEQALQSIESASREGVGEMRRLLDALTGDGREPTGAQAARPLADRLARAAERARGAGVDVSFAPERVPDGLGAETELVVERVVQEALTNVVRHAAPTACHVCVEQRGEAGVRMEIADTGPAMPGPPGGSGAPRSAGLGLRGMRARVAAAGGALSAGPEPGGGFRVEASLPICPQNRNVSPDAPPDRPEPST